MNQKNKHVVALIVVRMGSSRLPGKVMKPILNKPVLGYLIERAQRSKLIDQIVVTTSINSENDTIEAYCRANNVACFRGSEDDVLGRMSEALKAYQADVGVTIFGDGPLNDPDLMDQIIGFYLDHSDEYDFVGSNLKTTFPPGQETEVYSYQAMKSASSRAMDADVRENGTLYIRQNSDLYRLFNVEANEDLHYPEMEMELDTEEDFIVLKKTVEHLYPKNPEFTVYDVINFLTEHPEISAINKSVPRRWKALRSDVI